MQLRKAVDLHLDGRMSYGQLVDWAIDHHFSLMRLDYIIECAARERG